MDFGSVFMKIFMKTLAHRQILLAHCIVLLGNFY